MTIAKNNVVAKAAAVVAGLGLVALAFAPAANADTTSDLQAQIASLLAQIASLQAQLGGSQTTTVSVTFSKDLTVGSKGADVTALQTWLIKKGFTIAAGATGTFGPQTKAALAAYQAANGISPASGFFGPITRAKVNAGAGSTTGGTTVGGTTTGGTLAGAEGSIDNFKTVGASNTSLNSADSDQVLGFEFRATGSDLQVNRVDFDVVNNSGTGTIRPWGVFQTATLMDGNTTIGTVDASNEANWSQDGTSANGVQIYRVRFDGLKDVVKNGSTADFYLTLSTQNAISQSNQGGTYTITLPNQGLRAVDATGIQQYSSATVTTTAQVSSATSGSIVLSTGSDNPQTTTVQVDSNTSTTGITVNTFSLQAKDANVTLFSLPIRVATSTTPSGEAASSIVRTLKLYQGSTLLDTESIAIGQSATTTFQNLNFKIAQGSTVPFKIVAEINKIGTATSPVSGFAEGSGILVTVPGSGIDVENGSNTVSVTGSATGNTISFRSLGLSADAAPTTNVTTTVNGNSAQQTGTFTLTFNVTAFGQDVFVSSTTNGFLPTQVVDQNNAATTTAAASISSTADRSPLNNYVIHSGQTKSITVQFTKVGQSGVAQAKLTQLNFGTLDATPTTNSITLPTAYQTNQQFLQD